MLVARAVAVLLALAIAGCSRAASDAGAAPTASPSLPIATGNYPPYGHAPDFSWVAGRLMRSLPAGVCTYVVFSPKPGSPWGGRIALQSATSFDDAFPDGDMVVVTGSLVSNPIGTCGNPALALHTIEEH